MSLQRTVITAWGIGEALGKKFTEIKERLRVQLEYQLTNFRFCFPFGRPEGALKSTLSLLERVSINLDVLIQTDSGNTNGGRDIGLLIPPVTSTQEVSESSVLI